MTLLLQTCTSKQATSGLRHCECVCVKVNTYHIVWRIVEVEVSGVDACNTHCKLLHTKWTKQEELAQFYRETDRIDMLLVFHISPPTM